MAETSGEKVNERDFAFQAMQQQFAWIGTILQSVTDRLERLEQPTPRDHRNPQPNHCGEEEEEMEPVYQGNMRGRRRQNNKVDGELGNIKLNVPIFQGRSDLEAYLEWEKKVDLIFECHNYSEEKKVKLAAIEFTNYAIVWWDQLTTNRRRYGETPVST